MGIFAGNIFGAGENPLVTASKGELFVPIGDENHPPLARRFLIGFCALAVFVGLILFASYLHDVRTILPERSSSMIGKSIGQIGEVPATVKYAGVDLVYEVTDFEGLVTGCLYTAKVDVDELFSVARYLLSQYGEPGDFDKMALSALTKDTVESLDSATWTWECRSSFNAEPLEALDGWGSNIAGYYINPTKLYMDLTVTAGTDGEVDMVIRYEARPKY